MRTILPCLIAFSFIAVAAAAVPSRDAVTPSKPAAATRSQDRAQPAAGAKTKLRSAPPPPAQVADTERAAEQAGEATAGWIRHSGAAVKGFVKGLIQGFKEKHP